MGTTGEDRPIPGLALQKKEKSDSRQGEFQVGGRGWALRVVVHPDKLSTPRQLAEQINRFANAAADAVASPRSQDSFPIDAPLPGGDDVLGKLERVQALVEAGALSAEEAKALRADILRG